MGIHEFGSEESKAFIHRLREDYIPNSELSKVATIYVGGAAAQGVDFLNVVYGTFPFIFVAALAIAYFLLIRSFRSLILPLIAVVLDLISLAATYGLLVAVFRFGFLSPILGTYQVPQIEGWVPVFLFAVLFGLSMDYEVFIVTRMREARDKGESTADAIKEGLAHTGGVVTAAAIILVGALGGLANGHIAGLQELGVGLALGILIDATIVRTLLLPSVMTILGKWNWWLPQGVAKAAMTKASPLQD
jgi:RND superfamily putative drug exporter